MQSPKKPKNILIISQVFVPDAAAVGQHIADVAIELARRGHCVHVYASRRGYDDPSQIYPAKEDLHGVKVRRLPFSSFGKKSILTRLIGTVSFMLQAFFLALFKPKIDGVFFSTSPPMIGLVLTIACMIRRIPRVYWAMDLNPDQLLALGKIKKGSLLERVLEWGNRFILNRASLVVALDRFMADRLKARVDLGERLAVIPPWPHEQCLSTPAKSENPFALKHQLAGKFVIMYSGNHSPSNPLDTLLRAAEQLKDEPGLMFLFIGGGIGKKAVEQFVAERDLKNTLCLPYQPLSELGNSLSAGDLHVVSLGQDMVGIIHPCKIYGAMAVAKPILYLGPKPSHVSDILEKYDLGFHIDHGDVNGAVETLRLILTLPPETLVSMGAQARHVLQESLSQSKLCGEFCDRVEKAFG